MANRQTRKEMNFTKYDVLGFDMDYTLARYELVPFFNMAYEAICTFLVEVKHYDASIFHTLAEDRDLVYKGLLADFLTGNVLKLDYNGCIVRASHGTKKMTESEIIAVYGKDKSFYGYESLKTGMKSQDSNWRFFENYFDMPGLTAYCKIIDYKVHKREQLTREDYKKIWKDVYSGLEDMYTPTQFAANKGGYFPNIKAHTSKYIDVISSQIKTWLKNLRKDGRVVFLLTSSYPDCAHVIMETAFGQDWKSLFDICLYGARKPYFFTETKPFTELDGIEAIKQVDTMQAGVEYSGGNHKELMSFLSKMTGKADPTVLYFGDNLWADAWPSTQLGGWDSVLILEEMDAEGYAVSDGTVPGHDDELEDPNLPPAKRKRRFEHSSLITIEETELMASKFWGSVFIDDIKGTSPDASVVNETTQEVLRMNTAFGQFISMYANICVPSIEYLAGIPVDHSFSTFSSEPGNMCGFHPGRPQSLLPS